MTWYVRLLAVAVAVNGLIVGATLDQAIKQLPARHRMGVTDFSAYSRAGDLANGVAWYAILGVGAALLTLATVFVGRRGAQRRLLWLAAAATVGHMAVTGFAAPLNFSQKGVDDPAELARIFDTFERLNWLRAALQIVVLGALVFAAYRTMRSAASNQGA